MDWLPAPSAPRLAPAEVHVWRFPLDAPAEQLAQLAGWLAPEERASAEQMRFERDRRRLLARRGWLRLILSRYLARPPADLRFQYNVHGRPALVDGELEFNTSHSQGWGLAVAAPRGPLGVDIEWAGRLVEHTQIARRFFSSAEQVQLAALPVEAQSRGFFLCWTRKEAYIKALGLGLSLPLDRFDVSLQPGEPARLLAARDDLPGPAHLVLLHLEPAPEYVAAVCAPANQRTPQLWEVGTDWIAPR